MLDCTSLRQFSTLWWPGDFSLQWDASPQATGITHSETQSFTCFLWGIILFLRRPAVPGSQAVVYSAAARVSYGGFRSLLLLRSWLGVCCKPRPGFCTHSSSWTLLLLHSRQISSQFWPLLSEELFSPFFPSQPSIASAGKESSCILQQVEDLPDSPMAGESSLRLGDELTLASFLC